MNNINYELFRFEHGIIILKIKDFYLKKALIGIGQESSDFLNRKLLSKYLWIGQAWLNSGFDM